MVDQRGRVYLYVSEAARKLGLQESSVRGVLTGRRRSAGGFVFRYVNPGEQLRLDFAA